MRTRDAIRGEGSQRAPTPVILAPRVIGNVLFTCLAAIECNTIDFRSPMLSAAPSSDVKRFCWKIERRASVDGAHVPFAFCKHRSLSEALTLTRTVRSNWLSGEATEKLLPSASAVSVLAASERTVAGVSAFDLGSPRMDISDWSCAELLVCKLLSSYDS